MLELPCVAVLAVQPYLYRPIYLFLLLFLCGCNVKSKMFQFFDILKYYMRQCLICISHNFAGKSKNNFFYDNTYLCISFIIMPLSVSQNWVFSVILKAFTVYNKAFCYTYVTSKVLFQRWENKSSFFSCWQTLHWPQRKLEDFVSLSI